MPTEDEMRRVVIEEIERQGGTYFGPRPSRRPENYQPAQPMTGGEIFGAIFIGLLALGGVVAAFWFWGMWWGIGALALVIIFCIGLATDG